MSKCYLYYGKYYQDIGMIESPNQSQYLSAAAQMYEKSMEIAVSATKNASVKEEIKIQKDSLNVYCSENGFNL